MDLQSGQTPHVERFVVAIVAGGLALVAGLWLVSLFEARSAVWLLGLGLALLGVLGLAGGIWSQVEVGT